MKNYMYQPKSYKSKPTECVVADQLVDHNMIFSTDLNLLTQLSTAQRQPYFIL